MIDVPYFATNEDWFEFDYNTRQFVLRDSAPPEAVESYNEYMELVKAGAT